MGGFKVEEKLMKEIRNDMKLKRIPNRDNKVRPIFVICGICKKNKVTNHHFLCNNCWNKNNKNKLKKIEKSV